MPRVVLAPDKFKGTLTAAEVAQHLAEGIRSRRPDVELVTVPVADVGFGMEMSREVRGEIRNAKSIVARLIEDFRHDRESSLSRPID